MTQPCLKEEHPGKFHTGPTSNWGEVLRTSSLEKRQANPVSRALALTNRVPSPARALPIKLA